MDDVINLIDESEEEDQIWRESVRRRQKRRRRASPTQDIIDLTGYSDVFDELTSSEDNDIIDLTGHEDVLYGTHQPEVKSESEGSEPESKGLYSSRMNVDPCTSKALVSDDQSSRGSLTGSSSSLTSISSLCSAQSITDSCLHDEDLPGSRDGDVASKNMKSTYVNSLHLQDWSCQTTDHTDGKRVILETITQVPYITDSTSTLCTAMQDSEETSCSQSIQINRSLLYKLRYFQKTPVTHLFPHTLRHDKNLHAAPMPFSRVNMVNNTKDESFHQGTLYFLSEFVSSSHYPPKDIISHVINSVLLGAEEQTTRHDAYMILMKVQRLHPDSAESVAWEWNLLTEVMTKQEDQTCCLFLQYVVQTLEDDFHLCLRQRALHRCICKSLLSCDKSFCNVKQVIHWIIDAIKKVPEPGLDSYPQGNQQRVVLLLQRMLSLAVEVDNSPTMNSNKIADYIFPYVTVLKSRRQRKMFFTSTENYLLQAKILEVIFQHSCKSPQTTEPSLSFGKILFFISNSSPSLESQGPEWERWDEMLQHIIILCMSLRRVITDHLRTPIIDRPDEILKRQQSLSCLSEDITESEVNISLTLFKQQTSLGAELPAAILQRLFILRTLLHMAVQR